MANGAIRGEYGLAGGDRFRVADERGQRRWIGVGRLRPATRRVSDGSIVIGDASRPPHESADVDRIQHSEADRYPENPHPPARQRVVVFANAVVVVLEEALDRKSV